MIILILSTQNSSLNIPYILIPMSKDKDIDFSKSFNKVSLSECTKEARHLCHVTFCMIIFQIINVGGPTLLAFIPIEIFYVNLE